MHVDHALILALSRTKNARRLMEVSARLYRQLPRSDVAFGMYIGALKESGRISVAVDLLTKRVNERPRDVASRARLADLLTELGKKERAESIMRDSIRLGVATPSTFNNLAWLRLFADDVSEADVAIALEANTMTSFENPSHLHTLAALYAEIGKTKEAMQLVLRRMEMANADSPDNADWYLLGRIMHDYGLLKLARDAYERVENNEDRPTDSTWALARMKLRQLTREAGGKRI